MNLKEVTRDTLKYYQPFKGDIFTAEERLHWFDRQEQAHREAQARQKAGIKHRTDQALWPNATGLVVVSGQIGDGKDLVIADACRYLQENGRRIIHTGQLYFGEVASYTGGFDLLQELPDESVIFVNDYRSAITRIPELTERTMQLLKDAGERGCLVILSLPSGARLFHETEKAMVLEVIVRRVPCEISELGRYWITGHFSAPGATNLKELRAAQELFPLGEVNNQHLYASAALYNLLA